MSYFSNSAISNSDLKHIEKSWETYIWYKNNKTKPTKEMKIGIAFEQLLIDGTLSSIVVGDARTKEIKDKILEGYENISEADYKLVVNMVNAAKQSGEFDFLDEDFEDQKEMYQTINGIECRGKLDILTDDAIIDVKTIADIESYESACHNYKYYRQGAMYRELYRLETGRTLPYYLCFIEKKEPHLTLKIEIDPSYLEYGLYEIKDLLTKVYGYRENKLHTGFNPKTETIQIPKWKAL